MNMQQLRSFVRKIESLPEERREQVRILFHNPTDACVGVFASFCEWDACTLDEIVQTAKALGIDNATFIEDRFVEWTNSTSEEEAAFVSDGGDFDGTEDLNDARISKPHLFSE